jgi:hypothetical protein
MLSLGNLPFGIFVTNLYYMCYKIILVFFLLIVLTGCSVVKPTQVVSNTTQLKSLREMVNESIIQDMCEGDTLGKQVYLIK